MVKLGSGADVWPTDDARRARSIDHRGIREQRLIRGPAWLSEPGSEDSWVFLLSGVHRSLRPLPTTRTSAPVPICRSSCRRPVSSNGVAPFARPAGRFAWSRRPGPGSFAPYDGEQGIDLWSTQGARTSARWKRSVGMAHSRAGFVRHASASRRRHSGRTSGLRLGASCAFGRDGASLLQVIEEGNDHRRVDVLECER